MDFNNQTIRALATSLNMRETRNKLITSNIANAETPGYKAKRLEFESALRNAIDLDKTRSMYATDERHFNVGGGGIESVQPEIIDDPNGIVAEDGNTVDRDDEMARMAQNKILYDASIQMLNKKLGLLKYTISAER